MIKTRNISKGEYLECLVKEYFAAEMRSVVYLNKNDRNYWKRTAGYKKEKITDITTRNRIPSIFNDIDVYNKYYDKYYPQNELPLILDTDQDIDMYYTEGADVTITKDGETLIGRIEQVNSYSQSAIVITFEDNVKSTFSLKDIKRIL